MSGNSIRFQSAPGGGVAIGEPIESGTSGSVLFVNSSGQIAQNNSNLFWDNTSNRLGIGISAPTNAFNVSDGASTFTTTTALAKFTRTTGKVGVIIEGTGTGALLLVNFTGVARSGFATTAISAEAKTSDDQSYATYYRAANAGVIMASRSDRRVGIGHDLPLGQLHIKSTVTTNIGFIVQGIASQSGNLFEVQNSAAAILFGIEADGDIRTSRTAAATTLGNVTNKLPMYNAAGTLIGYVPLYDTIT